MTVIHIGKRKALPECCPKCGCGQEVVVDLSTLLKSYYGAWHAEPRTVWEGAATQWYGVCGACIMATVIYEPNPFMSLLKSSKTFTGNTYQLPFKTMKQRYTGR